LQAGGRRFEPAWLHHSIVTGSAVTLTLAPVGAGGVL
jgi:hypothetical protein